MTQNPTPTPEARNGAALSTVTTMAEARQAGTATTYEPQVTARAMMSGKAGTAERQAHLHAAIVAAGLTGSVAPATFTGPDGEVAPLPRLTPERLEVIDGIMRGESNTEIGARTFRSVETVKRHTGIMFRQWGVNSRVELVLCLIRFGAIPSPVEGAAHVEQRGRQWAVIGTDGTVVSRHRTEALAADRLASL